MISAERQSLLSAELSSAHSRSAFMDAISQVRAAFSFGYVTVMQMPMSHDMHLAPLILETTLMPEFVRDFDRLRLLRDSQTLGLLRTSLMPQLWSLDDCRDEELLPLGMLVLFRRFNISMGAMFPITSIDGSRFLFGFDGSRARLTQSEINELGMISTQAFDVYDRLRRRDQTAPNPLSARELEVVRWTAQGKTSVEIGQILALSDHTVNAYLTNAIKKLDCVNRTQLVAKSIRLKLIS